MAPTDISKDITDASLPRQQVQRVADGPLISKSKSRTTSDLEKTKSRSSRSRSASTTSTMSELVRTASIRVMDSHPPAGAWAATAEVTSKAPTVSDIKKGSYCKDGWVHFPQKLHGLRQTHKGSQSRPADARAPREGTGTRAVPASQTPGTLRAAAPPVDITPVAEEDHSDGLQARSSLREQRRSGFEDDGAHDNEIDGKRSTEVLTIPLQLEPHSDGYTPPPHVPWKKATLIALKGFWRFVTTFKGFLITLYALNVVAWGGMLFLLLVNAAPAMCRPTCEDLQSPRRIWLEIDAQILNALFCVTGLGLIPWRFKELYFLMLYRVKGRQDGLRKLAGIHRNWFRLNGSDLLDTPSPDGTVPLFDKRNPSLPLPLSKSPEPPVTGVRAPPTKVWKLDFVVWMNVWNTIFQICLCGVMWGLNRFDRPDWTTGLFIVLAMTVAAAGGIMMFKEGKKVKRVEGVAPPQEKSVPLDEEKTSHSSESD